jgi:hypothetical protein
VPDPSKAVPPSDASLVVRSTIVSKVEQSYGHRRGQKRS